MSDDNVAYEGKPRRDHAESTGRPPLPTTAGQGPGDSMPPSAPEPPSEAAEDAPPARAPETFATGTPDTDLGARVIEMIRTVYDPEIPVNIYDMGLVYEVRADDTGSTYVRMTLTSPSCPVAGTLPGEVESKVLATEGVTEARVELVWDPAWTMEMMTEEARLELNL